MVVLTRLLFDRDLRFIEREEEFAVQQVVLQLAVEERTGLVVVSGRRKCAECRSSPPADARCREDPQQLVS
jgi:hypothetical protein